MRTSECSTGRSCLLQSILRDQQKKHADSRRKQKALLEAQSASERRNRAAQDRRLWTESFIRLKTQSAAFKRELDELLGEEALKPLVLFSEEEKEKEEEKGESGPSHPDSLEAEGCAKREFDDKVAVEALCAEALQVAALLREGRRQDSSASTSASAQRGLFEEGAVAVLGTVRSALYRVQKILAGQCEEARAQTKAARRLAVAILQFGSSQSRQGAEWLFPTEEEEELLRLATSSHFVEKTQPDTTDTESLNQDQQPLVSEATATSGAEARPQKGRHATPLQIAKEYARELAKLREKHEAEEAQLAARLSTAKSLRRACLNTLFKAEAKEGPCEEAEHNPGSSCLSASASSENWDEDLSEEPASIVGRLWRHSAREAGASCEGAGRVEWTVRLLQILLPGTAPSVARAAIHSLAKAALAEQTLESSRRSFAEARKRLLAEFSTRLANADAESTRRAERMRVFESQRRQCEKLREKLRVEEKQREERRREERSLEARRRQAEQQSREELLAKERLRRIAEKEALQKYKEGRDLQKRDQERAEAERRRALFKESLRLRRVSAPVVAQRHAALLQRMEERRSSLRQKLSLHEKQKQLLLKKANALRPEVPRDRRRLSQATKSWSRRREAKNIQDADGKFSRLKHFHVTDAYSAAALMKDVRFRLSACFHDHGLSLSTAAREVLLKMSAPAHGCDSTNKV